MTEKTEKRDVPSGASLTNEEVSEMLRRAVRPLTREEIRLQKISFVMSCQDENGLTRRQVEELVDRL